MHKQDEDILRTFFRMEEARRQRLWLERLLHPEKFKWEKRGEPPPITRTKLTRIEELSRIGFGEKHYQDMLRIEASAKKELETLAADHPLAVHFERIRGLGMYLCGCFIAASGDIERTPTVSAFWKGMGLDVLNAPIVTKGGKVILPAGAVPRRIRGSGDIARKIPALPHVTKVGEQIRDQFARSGGKLAWWYNHFKELEPADKPKLFRHKSAQRLTQKLLYACLWREWRLARGLTAPDPYAFAILKHADGGMVHIWDFYEPEPALKGNSQEGRART